MSINTQVQSVSAFSRKLEDYKLLVKFRLNVFVVFSAVIAYLVVSGGDFKWQSLVFLALGGFLVTGAANALNEVLEKDYDKLMKRTAVRPLPDGRMSISEAVLAAGFMAVVGLFILALFNPLTSVLGSLAIISYAFIYTPLKRHSPIAVVVGAIPGALPVLIGSVAFIGGLTLEALVLFGIQFFWQFPHFWAIAWVANEDYKKAGYKLIPQNADGTPDPIIGKQSFIYTLMQLPLFYLAMEIGMVGIIGFILLTVSALAYAYLGWVLYKKADKASAMRLMFSSFLYLPLVLFILLISVFA
ncbi:MAG: protoheme IX farnesyltransferase [Saprospiraceae bacterium]|nr:protoheme IX farnesyltransferase [Saprospiraceae bacterium]